jgi:hypothetical protein
VGALKSALAYVFAMEPPIIVNGRARNKYSADTVRIAVNGRALVDPWAKATEFTHIKTATTGVGNSRAVRTVHRTQFLPFI